MNRPALLIACGVAASVSACAQAPAGISAAPVNDQSYAALSCPALAKSRAQIQADLKSTSAQQNYYRTHDYAGVLIIKIPVAPLLGHDFSSEIAKLKGKQEAVRQVMIAKGCR